MRTALYTTISLLVLLLLNCSIGVDVAGGSEIGNPITVAGTVLYPDNSPAHNALVRLRPESYLADTSGIIDTTKPSQIRDLRTDNAGNFTIDCVDTGTYSIEVNDENDGACLYIVELNPEDSTVQLPTRILQKRSILTGTVYCEYSEEENLFVQIFGMERITQTDSAGRYEFDDLPSGSFSVSVPFSRVSLGPWEKETGSIGAGETLHLDTLILIPYDINFENDSIIISTILNDLGNPVSFYSAVEIADKVHSIIGIYLNGLGMDTIPDEIFNLSPSIKTINLEDNNLPNFFIPYGAWTNCEELYLRNNRLTTVTEGVSLLNNIKIVDYSSNDITFIYTNVFTINSLLVLKVNDNNISSVPSEIGNIPSLESFEIAHNELTNLPAAIMNVGTLKHLDVNYNHLLSLSPQLDSWVKQFQPDYLLTQSFH